MKYISYKIEKVWAYSLLLAALENKLLNEISLDFDNLIELSNKSKNLEMLFNSQIITHKEREAVILSIFDKNKENLFRNFLLLLSKKDRISLISGIHTEFKLMKDAVNSEVRGTLESVLDFNEEIKKEIESIFTEKTSLKVTLDWVKNEDLLGGIIVNLKNKTFDSSIKKDLEKITEYIGSEKI